MVWKFLNCERKTSLVCVVFVWIRVSHKKGTKKKLMEQIHLSICPPRPSILCKQDRRERRKLAWTSRLFFPILNLGFSTVLSKNLSTIKRLATPRKSNINNILKINYRCSFSTRHNSLKKWAWEWSSLWCLQKSAQLSVCPRQKEK